MTEQQFRKVSNSLGLDKPETLTQYPRIGPLHLKTYSYHKQIEAVWMMYSQCFIPAAKKLDCATREELSSSLELADLLEDMQTTQAINETIRLGYVAVYHKFESFINWLTKAISKEFEVSERKLKDTFEDIVGFKVATPENGKMCEFRLICNLMKHNDGIASQKRSLTRFKHISDGERVTISEDEFNSDCLQFVEDTKTYGLILTSLLFYMESDEIPEFKPKLKQGIRSLLLSIS